MGPGVGERFTFRVATTGAVQRYGVALTHVLVRAGIGGGRLIGHYGDGERQRFHLSWCSGDGSGVGVLGAYGLGVWGTRNLASRWGKQQSVRQGCCEGVSDSISTAGRYRQRDGVDGFAHRQT